MRLHAMGLLIISALLQACAPAPQKMADSDRRSISSASIDSNITKPPAPYYLGPGGGVGLMFGALGAIASEQERADARSSLLAFVEKNGISIERIVLEEFSAALRSSGKLMLADRPGPGAAVIRIDIRQYGLSIPNGFSSNLVPILYLLCTMHDASGRTVWSASDRLLTLGNPVPGRPGEDLRNDPKAIENAWREAAKVVSANIVGQL